MTMTIYGIKNCSSVKRCLAYFDDNQLAYTWVDYKKTTPSLTTFKQFVEQFGANCVINKKGTTYKRLDEMDRAVIEDLLQQSNDTPLSDEAIATMYAIVCKNLSLIKRPIVLGVRHKKSVLNQGALNKGVLNEGALNQVALIGFDEQSYNEALQ